MKDDRSAQTAPADTQRDEEKKQIESRNIRGKAVVCEIISKEL